LPASMCAMIPMLRSVVRSTGMERVCSLGKVEAREHTSFRRPTTMPIDVPPDSPRAHPIASRVLRLLTIASAAALTLAILARALLAVSAHFVDHGIWDDAYMYVRYADHVLLGRGVRWNLQEPPTFGLTSLLYLAPVTLARAFTPDSDHEGILLTSFVCG